RRMARRRRGRPTRARGASGSVPMTRLRRLIASASAGQARRRRWIASASAGQARRRRWIASASARQASLRGLGSAVFTVAIFALLLRRVPLGALASAVREADLAAFLPLMVVNTIFYFAWDTLVLTVVIGWFHGEVRYG